MPPVTCLVQFCPHSARSRYNHRAMRLTQWESEPKMLSLDSVLCPCCRSPVEFPTSPKGKAARETVCEWCGNQLFISSSDPSSHARSEIDADFTDGSFGAIGFIIHTQGTDVCPQCARVYPKQVECCPGLIDFALKWYAGPPDRLGPNSRPRILDFISKHESAATLAILTLVLKWKIDEVADVPLDSLKEIAADLGPWATALLADC